MWREVIMLAMIMGVPAMARDFARWLRDRRQ